MKAFRNVGGQVVEITVDLDLSGNPILPPNTTVAPRPEANEGHYVTVVDNAWVQIPIPVHVVTLDQLKAEKQVRVKQYRDWLLAQPVEYEGVQFDADETARARLSQALIINTVNETFPPAWIAADDTQFPLVSFQDLKGIALTVAGAFSDRFFEAADLRDAVTAAADEAELEAVVIPSTGLMF